MPARREFTEIEVTGNHEGNFRAEGKEEGERREEERIWEGGFQFVANVGRLVCEHMNCLGV